MLNIHPKYQHSFVPLQSFDYYMTFPTEAVHNNQNRHTSRFISNDQSFFIKRHQGVGWKEIIKNLLFLRLPVINSKTEWTAIHKLTALGISTTPAVICGVKGWNPATQQSFLITKDLGTHISLEKLCVNWPQNPPSIPYKRALIKAVADIAATMHNHGVNHRDFYICHILLDTHDNNALINPAQIKLHLIDLHRAQCRNKVPYRWLIKDIGSLYFSALDIGLTKNDLYRFIKLYRQQSLREAFTKDSHFWHDIQTRAIKTYQKVFKREPKI